MVYVDAFLDDRSPMREEYGRLLRNLGADVRARLPAKMATLSHLVWKDGDEGGILLLQRCFHHERACFFCIAFFIGRGKSK